MVFCNLKIDLSQGCFISVTILILVDGFLQYIQVLGFKEVKVTILILVDGFLQ